MFKSAQLFIVFKSCVRSIIQSRIYLFVSHPIPTVVAATTEPTRMISRLGSRLPSWVNKRVGDVDDDDSVHHPGTDIELGRPKTKQEVDKVIFFSIVEKVKEDIDRITQATADVERINDLAQKATTTEMDQELSRRLRKTLNATNKRAKATRNLLGELKAENEKLKHQGELNASDVR